MEKNVSARAKQIAFLIFIGIFGLIFFNNCQPDGKLSVGSKENTSNNIPVDPPAPPPPPVTPPPPTPPAIDTFAINEVGGGGSNLTSGINISNLLFQTSPSNALLNRDGGTTKQNGVGNIYGLYSAVDPKDQNKRKFLVVDRTNHRILIFNTTPTSASVPDVVVGQPNFTSGTLNAGQAATNSMGLNDPTHVSVCGDGKMLISDSANHRVLIYNSIPKANGVAANVVVGQPNFTTNTSGVSATAFNTPYSAYCFNRKLYVVERINHRVLGYNTFPVTNGAAASFVIGQPDFVTGTSGCAANKFSNPIEMVKFNNELYVAEGGNNRVTRFTNLPTANGAVASNVIGQPNLTSCAVNQGVAAGPNTLNSPNSLAIGRNKLAVTDFFNNRILFFGLPASSNNPNAVGVIGQANYTAVAAGTISATVINGAKGVVFDGNYLWITNFRVNRLLSILLPSGI